MIEINLLPEDLRVYDKSAAGMRLVMFVGIPFLVVLAFLWVWLHFVVMGHAVEARNKKAQEAKEKKVKAEEVQLLQQDLADMQNKKTTVDNLYQLRGVDWGKKLMQITEKVSNTHCWLSQIQVKLKGGTGTLGLSCSIKGRSGEDVQKNVKQFLNKLGYTGERDANGERIFNAFWNDFIVGVPEDYYRGITTLKEVEGWLVFDLAMKLKIKPEVASRLAVGN